MKLARMLMILILAFALGGCGEEAGQTATPETPVSKPTATTESEPEPAPEPESEPVELTVPESGFSNGDGIASFGLVIENKSSETDALMVSVSVNALS